MVAWAGVREVVHARQQTQVGLLGGHRYYQDFWFQHRVKQATQYLFESMRLDRRLDIFTDTQCTHFIVETMNETREITIFVRGGHKMDIDRRDRGGNSFDCVSDEHCSLFGSKRHRWRHTELQDHFKTGAGNINSRVFKASLKTRSLGQRNVKIIVRHSDGTSRCDTCGTSGTTTCTCRSRASC